MVKDKNDTEEKLYLVMDDSNPEKPQDEKYINPEEDKLLLDKILKKCGYK